MPKRFSREFKRTHLRIYKDNWDWIVSASAGSKVKATEMIRDILDAAVMHLRARADSKINEALAELETLDLDFKIESLSNLETEALINKYEAENEKQSAHVMYVQSNQK